MKLFKSIALIAALALGTLVAACGSTTTTPSASEVQSIQNACAGDAALRPIVADLMPLATSAEKAGVDAAHAAIDQVCANPSGTMQANALAIVVGQSANVVALVSELQARKAAAAAKPIATAAPAASS